MGTWVSYFIFLGINFVHCKMRALEWIIFKVPYDSQQSHRKGEAKGVIWNKQNWHLPRWHVLRVKKKEPRSKNICPSRTKPHKVSSREAVKNTRGFEISHTWAPIPTRTPDFCQWESSLCFLICEMVMPSPHSMIQGRSMTVKVQQSSESGRLSQTSGLVIRQQIMSLFYQPLLQQKARWEGTSCLLSFPRRMDLLWPIRKPSPTRKMNPS